MINEDENLENKEYWEQRRQTIVNRRKAEADNDLITGPPPGFDDAESLESK